MKKPFGLALIRRVFRFVQILSGALRRVVYDVLPTIEAYRLNPDRLLTLFGKSCVKPFFQKGCDRLMLGMPFDEQNKSSTHPISPDSSSPERYKAPRE